MAVTATTSSIRNIRVIVRRDTAANWTYFNPVLLKGEPGYETDDRGLKYGDGETPWNELPYFTGLDNLDGGNPAGYGPQLEGGVVYH